jgi:hypothetical protein
MRLVINTITKILIASGIHFATASSKIEKSACPDKIYAVDRMSAIAKDR